MTWVVFLSRLAREGQFYRHRVVGRWPARAMSGRPPRRVVVVFCRGCAVGIPPLVFQSPYTTNPGSVTLKSQNRVQLLCDIGAAPTLSERSLDVHRTELHHSTHAFGAE